MPGSETLFDWVAGSAADKLSVGANPWLMMQIAAEARRRGYSRWNLCGAAFENVARFKSEFGGELVHGWTVERRTALEWGHQEARALAGKLLRRTGWRPTR